MFAAPSLPLCRSAALSVCRFVGLPRSTARYPLRRGAEEAILVERLHKFAKKRRRRGYRLAHRELRRDGFAVNHKRVYRLWKAHGLNVRPRRSRKRLPGAGVPRLVTAGQPHAVWSLDFLHDNTLGGGKLRVLCVSDEFTRHSLALEVGCWFGSEGVCRVWEEWMSRHGTPVALRMDNGPEFVALALRGLCHRRGINAASIEPGKPWQNGFAESFHARLRDEFLNGEVFSCVLEAQVRLSSWRSDWNGERLHSSLDYVTPNEFAARWEEKTENRLKTKAQPGS